MEATQDLSRNGSRYQNRLASRRDGRMRLGSGWVRAADDAGKDMFGTKATRRTARCGGGTTKPSPDLQGAGG